MRKATILLTCLSLLFLIVVMVNCKKQDGSNGSEPPTPAPKPGVLQGRIVNEYNQLLNGATVSLQGNNSNTSVQTSSGHYIFSSIQPGSYHLSVKKEGYIETSAAISINPGDTTASDFTLKAGTAYFNLLSDSVIVAKPYAGTFTIKIASNTSWVISNATNWAAPAKLNGNGEDSIVVRVDASSADTTRQGNLVLQAGGIVRNILIKQLPDVKLLQTMAIPGNSTLGISDSIALLFNQPLTVKSIFPGLTTCQSAINFSYAGNKVTFSYACAALGGDYPFTITTANSLGDQYTFTFTAGFYEKIINLTGTIQNYFLNDADNSYWIITDHPNMLYKIDMNTFAILHQYSLPNEPALFTISPYNNKIYLAYKNIPKLYILDQSGTTEKVIDIPHDTTRGIYESNGPHIYPSWLAFTSSGKGMIWLGDRYGGSYPYFWFIDAADNHRIWYQSAPGNNTSYYLEGKTNYDKTKLILTAVNGDPTISTFDPQQMRFSSYKPGKVDIGGFVTPSRKNGNIFIGQLYFQSIANPATGFETPAINKDNRNGGNVDFCYKPGRDQTVYFTENGYMQAVDYTTLTSPVKYDAIYFLKGTTATLDGRYIIANRHDGNYNAKVIQLPAAWFDY